MTDTTAAFQDLRRTAQYREIERMHRSHAKADTCALVYDGGQRCTIPAAANGYCKAHSNHAAQSKAPATESLMDDGQYRHWRNNGRPEDHIVSAGLKSVRCPQDTYRAECSCGFVTEGSDYERVIADHRREVGA